MPPQGASSLQQHDVLTLKHALVELEKAIAAVPLARAKASGEATGKRFDGSHAYKLVSAGGVDDSNFQWYEDTARLAITTLTAITGRRGQTSLEHFLDLLKVLFSPDMRAAGAGVDEYFAVYIKPPEPKRARGGRRPPKPTWGGIAGDARGDDGLPQGGGRALCFWCFSPGFTLKEFCRGDDAVHSIILTSGTLSPMASFTAEMMVPFPITLENPHVIDGHQLCTTVVRKGPLNEQLSSAFTRRSDDGYKVCAPPHPRQRCG